MTSLKIKRKIMKSTWSYFNATH